MLTITETKQSGATHVWTAEHEDDFCVKVMRAIPRGTWNPDWSFAQFCAYLAADLRDLDIVES
jgi:hypothetical protein